jgi:hypothetical protein
MKIVRCFVGAAGLAPVAIGMATPANAATTALSYRAGAPAAKTVLLPASSVSGTNNRCTGHVYSSTPTAPGGETLQFFWTPETATRACIGGVDFLDSSPGVTYQFYARVRIYARNDHNGGPKRMVWHSSQPGSGRLHGIKSFHFDVHHSWAYRPLQICGAVVSGLFGHVNPDDITCTSVG